MDSKDTRQIRDQKLATGLQKHASKFKSFTIAGQDYKTSEIIRMIKAGAEATEDCATKKAAYHAAVEAEAKAKDGLNDLLLGVRNYLYLTCGNSSAALADFGLSPRTKRTPTVETKADAADKMRATRKARGTKGKRQREEIVAGGAPAEGSDAPAANGVAPAAPTATPAATRPAPPSN